MTVEERRAKARLGSERWRRAHGIGPMKAPLPTEELRYDMSQFYPLKAVLEELLGRRVYLQLKETGTLRDWKVEIQKLLRAIKTAIESTVELADDDWFADVDSTLEDGKKLIPD